MNVKLKLIYMKFMQLVTMLFLMTEIYSQSTNNIFGLKNQNVYFEFYHETANLIQNDTLKIFPYLIIAIDTRSSEVISTDQFSDSILLNMLLNKRTDWAANIILYDKYDIEASDFLLVNNIRKWRRYKRVEDIKFWFSYIALN